MNGSRQESTATARLVRYAVWGQMAGYTFLSVTLAIEDYPEVFARAGVLEFIWPVLVVVAMHLFALDRIAGRYVPLWLLVGSVFMISIGTLVASLTGVAFAFGVPDTLATSGWRFLQASAIVTVLIFLVSLIVNAVMSVRAYQSKSGNRVGI